MGELRSWGLNAELPNPKALTISIPGPTVVVICCLSGAQRLVICTLRNEPSSDTLMMKMGGHMSKTATKLK